MRLYILSTNWRKKGDEYFLTYSVYNKRKFYRRTHHFGEYPTIVYRNDISFESFEKIKSLLILLSEVDASSINYDNDINDYGYWIKIKLNAIIAVVETEINQVKVASIDNIMSKCLENMSISKKRCYDNLDNSLLMTMETMNISKRIRNIDDPYMADTEG